MITHSKDNGLQKPIAKAHGLVLLYSPASRYSPWGYITFLSLICWPTSGISQDSPCLNTKQKTLGPMWLLQWSLLRSLIESWWRFSNLCTQLGNPDLTHAVCQSLHSHAQCIRLIIGIGFYPALSSHFPKRAVLLHYRVLQVQPWVELELICLAAVPGKMDQPGFSTYPHLLPTQCFGGSPENPPKPVYKKKKEIHKRVFSFVPFPHKDSLWQRAYKSLCVLLGDDERIPWGMPESPGLALMVQGTESWSM